MHIRQNVAAAIGNSRMRVHDCPAPVQLFHDGYQRLVAEPFVAEARHDPNTIGVEVVEDVFDFIQTIVDIG